MSQGISMTSTTDRYISYQGIDCAGNSRRLMELLLRHINDPAKSNVFWDRFKEKLALAGQPKAGGGQHPDELFLIHTYINNLFEFFEEVGDEAALALLDQIERECC